MHLIRSQAQSIGIPAGNRFSTAAVLCAIFLFASAAIIFDGYDRGRGSIDQNHFHLPAIRQFARQWPRLDLRDYPSSTTPGFHIVVALADRYVGQDVRLLRFVGLLFTLGLIATLAAALASRVKTGVAIALALPFTCSPYTFASGAWLLPDNAGWWGILALLLLALDWRDDWAHYFGATVLLVLSVLARQVDIWAAGVLWVAVWLGPADADAAPGRYRRMALIFACTLPAALTLAYFAMLWHGLIPPWVQPKANIRGNYGTSYSAPAFTLVMLGIFGPFFMGAFTGRISSRIRAGSRPTRMIVLSFLLGALVGMLPKTSYEHDSGRYSGIWNVVRHLPVFAQRSPLIVLLAALGGAILATICFALERRERIILLAALLLFVATQFANANAWQRYYEPFVLILLALMGARTLASGPKRPATGWKILAGPIVLSMILAVVTFFSLR